jgi:hypothetical protein
LYAVIDTRREEATSREVARRLEGSSPSADAALATGTTATVGVGAEAFPGIKMKPIRAATAITGIN